MVRLGIALKDRQNDQPLRSLCNFRSTAMFSLLLTCNLFTPQNTAFITASDTAYYNNNDTDYYTNNDTEYYTNNDTDYYDTNYNYDDTCKLGAGKGTDYHDEKTFLSNDVTHQYEGEIYSINVEYNYEIFAKEEDDNITEEIEAVEKELALRLLPLLFPDECPGPDRGGGDTLNVIVGVTSEPPDVVDDNGCVNTDVEQVKNTFCIRISGSLTVYSKSNDDNIKTLVGEELNALFKEVFKKAATLIEGRNIKKVDVKKKSIKVTWTDNKKKKSDEMQWWKITAIVIGSSFLLITVVRVVSKKLKERQLFTELTTTRNFKDQKSDRLSVTKLLHSIRKDRHTPRSDVYASESARFRDDPIR